MTPPWIVRSWPPVLWPADHPPELRFVHLGTRVLSAGDPEHPCSGQTVWGDSTPDKAAGVAWDWVELQSGVVAMSDPISLVSNLQLVDSHGGVLTGLQAAMHLNQIVHTLPWQDEVARALHHDAA